MTRILQIANKDSNEKSQWKNAILTFLFAYNFLKYVLSISSLFTCIILILSAPELSRLSLVLLTENVRMTTLSVVWMVRGENAREINRFDIIFKDNQGRTLLSQSIPGQTRSFNLRGLAPATEYQVELYAFDDPSSRKAAAEARTTVTTLREDPVTTVGKWSRNRQ